ncbi:MAG: hypothetical protein A2004_04660 [Spirochaetes bacterium GWC1_61_12]|nr:MAG: hypothetical protein A2004_04660 [Spirochaetes bacterium GWC1_61_12]
MSDSRDRALLASRRAVAGMIVSEQNELSACRDRAAHLERKIAEREALLRQIDEAIGEITVTGPGGSG